MANLIFLGPPGCGKGTQSAFVREKFQMEVLATGDLLRKELAAETELGHRVKETIDAGRLVSDAIMVDIIRKNLAAYPRSARHNFIFDGFPRTVAQAEALDGLLSEFGSQIDFVFLMELELDSLISRLTGRFACTACGAVYHEQYHLPAQAGRCDICGGTAFSRRSDDTEATAVERYTTYQAHTMPLISYYGAKLVRLDATSNKEAISQVIVSYLGPDLG